MREINYFGKPYSFTHIAALKRYGDNGRYNAHNSIEETIFSIKKTKRFLGCQEMQNISDINRDSLGIVPIENTYGGIITDTLEIMSDEKFLNSDLEIKEELELGIKLLLLGKGRISLKKIKKIYSHEYPLKIAQAWIKENFPYAEIKKVASTSGACQLIENDDAAIASQEAADYYKLKKIMEIPINGKQNLTRFFVLGTK